MGRRIYKTGWHKIVNKKGKFIKVNYKPSNFRNKKLEEDIRYNYNFRIWLNEKKYKELKESIYFKEKRVLFREEELNLIMLNFDMFKKSDNKSKTKVYGYFSFTSFKNTFDFDIDKLKSMVIKKLGAQGTRALHFKLALEENQKSVITPHIVVLLDGEDLFEIFIDNFKEENYYV